MKKVDHTFSLHWPTYSWSLQKPRSRKGPFTCTLVAHWREQLFRDDTKYLWITRALLTLMGKSSPALSVKVEYNSQGQFHLLLLLRWINVLLDNNDPFRTWKKRKHSLVRMRMNRWWWRERNKTAIKAIPYLMNLLGIGWAETFKIFLFIKGTSVLLKMSSQDMATQGLV